ncbi:MAG: helix-turn-helix transcriptional regulator [Clostridiaceae bacterium]|jgi:transcriptional regulator with XRE-family HTH domain|nr:helix-turn-helix transcriptional regulator [Clostridiaceae bacterium]
MDTKKIGTFLKELRNENNLTQEQLAERMYVSGRTVSRWETGATLPNIAILIDLSEFYNVDIREILDGEKKEQFGRKGQITEEQFFERRSQFDRDAEIVETRQIMEREQVEREEQFDQDGHVVADGQIDEEGQIAEKDRFVRDGQVKKGQITEKGKYVRDEQIMEKEQFMEKEKENTILKVAEYNQEEKKRIIKKGQIGFIICFIFSLIKFTIEILDLKNDEFWYKLADFVRGFIDGFIFVMIIVGILYTTNLLNKIKKTKQRILRGHKG